MSKLIETNNGTITDITKATQAYNRFLSNEHSITENRFEELVESATELSYIDDFGNECIKEDCNYKLIKLPDSFVEVGNDIGRSIYVSMFKDRRLSDSVTSEYHTESELFKGYFVGTYDYFVNRAAARSNEYYNSFSEYDSQNDYLEDIYDKLMDKEHFKIQESLHPLKSYLRAIYQRCIKQFENNSNVLISSNDKEKHCFNTKLLDKFGNFIYISCDSHNTEAVENAEIIVSKSDYARAGYRGYRPHPVSFFDDIGDVVFDASIDDFDLEDTSRLEHLVDITRKSRLPHKYQNMSPVDMANSVRYSIEISLKKLVTDYKHIVPMYNIKNDKIQYLIPLSLEREYAEIPEVALIVTKHYVTGFYVVATLIDIAAAYTNARVISASTSNWLEKAISKREETTYDDFEYSDNLDIVI